MTVMENFFFPLVLMCGSFHDAHSTVSEDGPTLNETENVAKDDPMLDQIATDVMEDIVQVLVGLAGEIDAQEDVNEVDGFFSTFKVAGIDFEIQATSGVFRDITSLRTTGKTKMSQYFTDTVHQINIMTPITFDTFEIDYDSAVVKATDGWRRWNGDLKLKVRKNEFNLLLTVEHIASQGICQFFIEDAITLQYTDADVDLSLEGLPELHVTNVSNKVRYGRHYEGLVVRRLLESYLNTKSMERLMNYCVFQQKLEGTEKVLQRARYAEIKRRQERRWLMSSRMRKKEVRRYPGLSPNMRRLRFRGLSPNMKSLSFRGKYEDPLAGNNVPAADYSRPRFKIPDD